MNQLGSYELLDVLGQGGMGRVYRARDKHGRIVALKVIAEDKAQEADYLKLFRREADLVGRLTSPHVIPIHDYNVIDGQAYLDMRYVPGEPLSQVVRRRGPAGIDTALKIIEQAATALDDAHAGGVVHRDVKPANLLVNEKGFVYLADFGIAVVEGHRGHEGSQILGSWPYMAPERFDPTAVQGFGCDVYALACVLYFALTGKPPFPGKELAELRQAHRHTPAPTLMGQVRGMTPALDSAIRWALAKDPQQRPSSCGAWVKRLREVQPPASRNTGSRPAPPPQRPLHLSAPPTVTQASAPVPGRSHGLDFLIGLLVLLALVMGGVIAVIVNQH